MLQNYADQSKKKGNGHWLSFYFGQRNFVCSLSLHLANADMKKSLI